MYIFWVLTIKLLKPFSPTCTNNNPILVFVPTQLSEVLFLELELHDLLVDHHFHILHMEKIN
jgi:hypothetical protein